MTRGLTFGGALWAAFALASCGELSENTGEGWAVSAKSVDADGDGFGDDVDCDDADPGVNPDAAETCDSSDEDCDGIVDEACDCASVTDDGRTWMFCPTADTWAGAQAQCAAWGSHLADVDDDVDDASIFAEAQATAIGNWWIGLNDRSTEGSWEWDGGSDTPYTHWRAGEPNDYGGNEDCAWYAETGGGAWNDKDCAATAYFVCQTGCVTHTRYADVDGDGYGDSNLSSRVCDDEAGWVDDAADCDDADATVSPDTLWYADSDGDGFGGSTATIAACEAPIGYEATPDDCDDGDSASYPGATEVPADGLDQDCDGVDGCTWFADADGDGWGDDAASTEDCSGAPLGFVAAGGDCDDADAAAFPGATDAPYDGVDTDCGGGSDDDADGDGSDGNGGPDCDDTAPAVAPGVVEACDGIDQDCDGAIDVGAACPAEVQSYDDHGYFFVTTADTWEGAQAACADVGYHLVDVRDAAEEAWIWGVAEAASPTSSWWHGANDRDTEGTFAWDGGSGSAFTDWRAGEPNDFGGSEDCAAFADDGAGAWNDRGCTNLYPFVCEAGCEVQDLYADADGDGAGDPSTLLAACDVPVGYVADNSDCDDSEAAVLPGAVEVCDDLDNDCDGVADDADPGVDPTTFGEWYADHDGDGDGVATETLLACAPPPGWAATATDCDDGNPAIYAGAPDPVDGVDANCAGDDEDWDSDGDGVWDTVERRFGLDPANADSDDDGLADGEELDEAGDLRDSDGDGEPDALDADDDGDTLPTSGELGPDGATDTDGDGTPDHLDLDSDDDGSPDADEAGRDSDHDGVPNAQEADDDGDGLPSREEDAVDADGDGVADPDIDGDGVPNSLDQDSDADGCRDADEPAGAWADAATACAEEPDSAGDEGPGTRPPPGDGECGCGSGGVVTGNWTLFAALAAFLRRRVPRREAAR